MEASRATEAGPSRCPEVIARQQPTPIQLDTNSSTRGRSGFDRFWSPKSLNLKQMNEYREMPF